MQQISRRLAAVRIKRRGARLAAFVVAVAGCAAPSAPPIEDDGEVSMADRARELSRELVIVDGHVDLPYRLMAKMEDVTERTSGDFDYPRAREGGLDAPFMSIYVPAEYQQTGGATEYADQLIDLVEGLAAAAPDTVAIARSVADVRSHFAKGLISLPMGMENGAPIGDDLANLEHFYDRGIRYITLTHGENNQICDSSYAEEREWNGLSPFGREVIAEMNRLGIMIDVSHLSDDAVEQVMALTEAPVIASHSSCRRFTPGWERNMSDELIERLAENGGVIMINFGSAFLRADAYEQSRAFFEAFEHHLAENGLERDSPEAKAFTEAYMAQNPRIYADLADVVAHIDHVVDLVGIDHVGFGSDFDGVGDSLPTGLKDVSQYPNLVAALLEAGYSEDDLRKMAGENLLRVWSEVETVAERLQATG